MNHSFRNLMLIITSSALLASACQTPAEKKETMQKGITKTTWGQVDGKDVYLYTLTNANGEQVTITNYGGTLTSWLSNDNKGNRNSIVLGFDSLKGYLTPPPYFGALIGRYGNRIAKGKFSIGDSTYTLAVNNGANALHGGLKGFDKVVWDASIVNDTTPALLLHYQSHDGEEGYPGNLDVQVRYDFTDDNAVQITYDATTDKPTVVNLTNHSYFNLTGDHTNTILNHVLQINADYYTPVDSGLIPTGKLEAVLGTPFDFNFPEKIGARIDQVPGGYDHNFVLRRRGDDLEKVASLSDSLSGRTLEVYTTQPGLQFYSGNFLDGTLKDDKGVPFNKHTGLCLETQHFPDSPNQPNFPSTLLKPGEKFHSVTKYKLVK
jgi:aldose 1-epimerase